MNNKRYVIDGKTNGVFRMIITSAISIVFAVLSVNQLIGGNGKNKVVGLMFSAIFISSLFVSIPLIIRYFFFKVCINEKDFYIRTTPFNAKTYRYSEVKNASTKLMSSTSGEVGGSSQPTYFHYFYFTDSDNKIHKFQFEKSIYEKEINELMLRINNN